MTLPRKGDRVRVVASATGATPIGTVVTLESEIEEHFADGLFAFNYIDHGELMWSGAVAVEILEQANRQDLHRGLQSVIDRADRGDTRAVSPGANQYEAGFVAGLRRAQELANDLVGTHYWGQLDHDEFNQAIDAEAAKERT